MKMKSYIKKFAVICAVCIVLGILALLISNVVVISDGKSHLTTVEEAATKEYDCILILGCGVRDDGSMSLMLKDRMDKGIALYKAGIAPKLLVSGDHGREQYDEVNTMKAYAIEQGVPSEDVFMDHAGFSTYESMYRAKEIFGAEKIVVVTQEYHMYRALYAAHSLGIEADGIPTDPVEYGGQLSRDIREVLARTKEVITCIIESKPSYLGEPISLEGSGDVTNDKELF